MSGHGIPRISGDREKDREKEKHQIHAYNALVEEVQQRRQSRDFSIQALELSARLLVKNPEYYTIWNFRRRALKHQLSVQASNAMSIISSDLQFLLPLLIQYPKCYWIWNYRSWLLHQMEEVLELSDTLKLWSEELGLVGKMLIRDERNFHGWDYRRHVVAQIERLRGPSASSLVESEFDYSSKMIRSALQNFSALHYRSKLIPRLLEERKATPDDRRKFLQAELDLMQDALIDPFNQSAWFYHQHLISCIFADSASANAIVLDLSDEERADYFDQEIGRIREILEDYDDCKLVYQILLQYHVDADRVENADSTELSSWLREVKRLDPMRAARWNDLESRIRT